MAHASRLMRRPAADVFALGVAVTAILLGFLVPLYTDEVGWRFQTRSAIDGGVDRSLTEHCGPNTVAVVPLFMRPLRSINATVNLALPDPIVIRLIGVASALLWIGLLWSLVGMIARTPHER